MLQVTSEGGRQHVVPVKFALQLGQDPAHLLHRHLDAQELVDPVGLQGDPAGRMVGVVHVDHAAHHFAGAQQLHQLAGPLHSGDCNGRVQLLLKPAGGFGAHPQLFGGDPHRGPVEAGGFEDHHVGVVHDAAVFATHDARHRRGLDRVGDHQHIGGQLPLHPVQGDDRLARFGVAHHDLAPLHILVVEGVHRLAILQHHIVGDIHDIVDGAHAAGPQPLPHPAGGGGDLDVFHHPGGVPQAEVGGLHLHAQVVADIVHRMLHLGGGEVEGLIKGGRRLPGQASDRQAVGTVGGDLELHAGVVEPDGGADILPQLHVRLLEDEDAVLLGVGEVVGGEAQLRQGAEHPVALLPPQLAAADVLAAGQPGVVHCHRYIVPLVDVLGAGDDLDQFRFAHIHLADKHVVGVGVPDDLLHAPHQDIFDLGALLLVALHLGAGHGHGLREFTRAHRADVHIVGQPLHRKIHFRFLRV